MSTYDVYVTVLAKKNQNAKRIFNGFHYQNARIVSVDKLEGGCPSVWGINIILDSMKSLQDFRNNFCQVLNKFCSKNKMQAYDTDILEEGGEIYE